MLDYDCQNASKLGVPMSIRLMEEIRAGEIIIVVEVKCSRHMGDILLSYKPEGFIWFFKLTT